MIQLRAAAAADAAPIRQVLIAAFPTRAEADLVERLEAEGGAAIALVAEEAGEVVGHVMFSRMRVEADGQAIDALGLGPVAVLPKRQRQGIGSALIDAGLREARALGSDMVFLLGEPEYYGRFGFTADAAEPFASPYAGPYFQALALREDAAAPKSGRAEYAPAFAGLE